MKRVDYNEVERKKEREININLTSRKNGRTLEGLPIIKNQTKLKFLGEYRNFLSTTFDYKKILKRIETENPELYQVYTLLDEQTRTMEEASYLARGFASNYILFGMEMKQLLEESAREMQTIEKKSHNGTNHKEK